MVAVVVGGCRECDGLGGHCDGGKEEEEWRDGDGRGNGSRHRLIGEPGQLIYFLTLDWVVMVYK